MREKASEMMNPTRVAASVSVNSAGGEYGPPKGAKL
jgi:hypothetical protein